MKLSLGSPKGSFLKRVYELSDKRRLKSDFGIAKDTNKIILTRDQLTMDDVNFYQLFTFLSEIHCMSVLFSLGGNYQDSIVYIDERPIFEIYSILYYSNKNLSEYMKKL